MRILRSTYKEEADKPAYDNSNDHVSGSSEAFVHEDSFVKEHD